MSRYIFFDSLRRNITNIFRITFFPMTHLSIGHYCAIRVVTFSMRFPIHLPRVAMHFDAPLSHADIVYSINNFTNTCPTCVLHRALFISREEFQILY